MALVVEDGTGLSTAESYLSVADANAYHTAMGNTGWTGADAAKEVALRRGAQYLDANYQFRGVELRSDQALAWPRDYDDWPVTRVKHACAEAALRALAGTLFVDETDRSVRMEQVGPIKVEYGDARYGGQTRYAVIDALLAPLTMGGRMGMRIERAA